MTHVNLGKQHPAAYEKITEFDAAVQGAVATAGLDPKLVELVKIRVSQLNGCAFCLRMHTRDALALGESTDRLAVVAAWWESQYFTPQEQAGLALAEDVTGLPRRTQETLYDDVLTADERSALTWLAILMNAWNRIAIQSHYPVGGSVRRAASD
ncbi:carboxymuconolactone decarboxylase family protein [Plantibacter sp. YIM 135347]|uniref:carboxymuconolactone decarboxylase family protein n=1 Tax=Plantibacter sp. YIM 135347 TaxID=3423919 RepID=UPI003D3339FA